ncbi:MAG: DUF2085 domain-containing protein [Promethearchaeota archaeon]
MVCFQWEVATFKVGSYYLPVCSGCFGIYTGALIGFTSLPRLSNLSKQLFNLKLAIPLLLPMSIYFFILNVERYAIHAYPIPGVKFVYFAMGILFGFILGNIALRLALIEDAFHPTVDQYIIKFTNMIGRMFPGVLVGVACIILILALLGFSLDMLLLVLGSLSFLIGLFTLLILIVAFTLRFSLGIIQSLS